MRRGTAIQAGTAPWHPTGWSRLRTTTATRGAQMPPCRRPPTAQRRLHATRWKTEDAGQTSDDRRRTKKRVSPVRLRPPPSVLRRPSSEKHVASDCEYRQQHGGRPHHEAEEARHRNPAFDRNGIDHQVWRVADI